MLPTPVSLLDGPRKMDQSLSNHALLGNNYKFDSKTGTTIDTRHQRLAEIVSDYDPHLSIAWVPGNVRGPEDIYPWALMYNGSAGEESYMVCNFTEEEANHPGFILGRIFQNDAAKHGNILDEMDARNRAIEIERAKKREDEIAEKKELAKAIIKSNLHTFRHNGRKWRL